MAEDTSPAVGVYSANHAPEGCEGHQFAQARLLVPYYISRPVPLGVHEWSVL
jgi:hypothetical protein